MKRKVLVIIIILSFISLNLAIITAFISITNYVNFKREELTFQQESLKNDLINSCLEKSIVKTPEKEEPILYIYDICIKDKGAETVYSYGAN
jgi:hypothetical protein